MAKVTAFMAQGMEEVECLTVVDILRRGGVEVQTVALSGKKKVTGSHQIPVKADVKFKKADFSDSDLLFLPGGVPGVPNLMASKKLAKVLKAHAKAGKRLAAICAAPSVLGHLGLLRGKKATCFPGWQKYLEGAEYTGEGVVTDGLVTTGKGLGYAIDFALELLRLLKGEATADEIKARIQYKE